MQRKCSICGAPMTKTPGGYKCSGCPNVEPLYVKRPIFSGTSSTPQSGYGTQRSASNKATYNSTSNTTSMNQKTQKKKSNVPVVLLSFVVLLVIGFSMVFFPLLGMQMSRSQEDKPGIDWRDYEDEQTLEYEADAGGFASGTMSQIVYKIFGKNAEEVTEEELATIQYIEMDGSWTRDGVVFRYSTEDYHDYLPDTWDRVPDYTEEVPFSYKEEFRDTLQTVQVKFVDGDSGKVYGDLENFKGVKALNLSGYSSINLSKLPNLTMIICNNTEISTLLKSNVPVDQIESLHAYYIDLEGIEQFTALKRLFLENNDFSQLELVAECESLEELYCVDLKGDKSYQILSKMPDLKTLYIDGSSDGVKDLSVLSQLTSLESLTVVDTDILNVDFLKGLEDLKVLRLSGNGLAKDLRAIGELADLEYLELDINASNGGQHQYDTIKNLKNLKSLALDTVYELDFLYDLDQLEELEIDLTFYNNLMEPIKQMKNLEKLSLISCHSQFTDGFTCLMELPNLKYLRVEDMEFDDPVDGLFTLGQLEELHITRCDMYVAPLTVTVGENLKVLNLTSTNFRVMPRYGEYMYVGYDDPTSLQSVLNKYFKATSLEELYLDWCVFEDLEGISELSNLEVLSLNYCDLMELPGTDLTGCESLRELYLRGNQISDISFVMNLTALEYIDLRDCYVTDISPLRKCKNLQYVNVRNNPISSNPLVGVEVISE